MRRIRVLEILEATIGGTKRHLLDLCDGLDSSEFDVVVACPLVRSEARGDTSFVDDLGRTGVSVSLVPMVRRISPARDLLALAKLARIIRRGRFDVIHAHSSKAGFLGRQAALADPRASVIYSPHGFYFLNFRDPFRTAFFKLAEKLAAKRMDLLLTLSRGEYQIAVTEGLAPAGHVRLIENGIDHVECYHREDARARLGLPKDALVVGTISRFTPQKAPLALIEAVSILASRRPGMLFAWFSDGEMRPQVEAEIARRGLKERVQLFGYRSDARLLLPALDVFVLASRWEGLPYTVMEAMDAGVPVVATDVAGTQDFIDDGRNGWLVPVDKPTLLAARVDELLTRPQLLAEIADVAEREVRVRYSRTEMVRKIAALYHELAKIHPHG